MPDLHRAERHRSADTLVFFLTNVLQCHELTPTAGKGPMVTMGCKLSSVSSRAYLILSAQNLAACSLAIFCFMSSGA